MVDTILRITLAVVIGTLAAIVYSLRVLVLMERRMAKIEMHVDRVTQKILKEELKIEKIINKENCQEEKIIIFFLLNFFLSFFGFSCFLGFLFH